MITIIDGCGTNVASIQFALARIGKKATVTANPDEIKAASHVLIPGVSTAQRAMTNLQQNGLVEVLRNLTQPVLGICSGMQILFQHSAEGNVNALNIFPQSVNKLEKRQDLSLPHMGWNTLDLVQKDNPILNGVPDKSYVYYVHSFATPCETYTVASTHYGESFSAIVVRNNFYGMQFHPERSGKIGERLLYNFLQEV